MQGLEDVQQLPVLGNFIYNRVKYKKYPHPFPTENVSYKRDWVLKYLQEEREQLYSGPVVTLTEYFFVDSISFLIDCPEMVFPKMRQNLDITRDICKNLTKNSDWNIAPPPGKNHPWVRFYEQTWGAAKVIAALGLKHPGLRMRFERFIGFEFNIANPERIFFSLHAPEYTEILFLYKMGLLSKSRPLAIWDNQEEKIVSFI